MAVATFSGKPFINTIIDDCRLVKLPFFFLLLSASAASPLTLMKKQKKKKKREERLKVC